MCPMEHKAMPAGGTIIMPWRWRQQDEAVKDILVPPMKWKRYNKAIVMSQIVEGFSMP